MYYKNSSITFEYTLSFEVSFSQGFLFEIRKVETLNKSRQLKKSKISPNSGDLYKRDFPYVYFESKRHKKVEVMLHLSEFTTISKEVVLF